MPKHDDNIFKHTRKFTEDNINQIGKNEKSLCLKSVATPGKNLKPGVPTKLRLKLKYPFYSYENEMYSKFMIQIMNCLEVRFFNKNQVIAKEMDEC